MAHYSEKKDLFPLQGGCSCGHIRYQLEKAPLVVHCCHCTDCMRQVGSAFAINAVVESEYLTLLPPADKPPAGAALSDAMAALTIADVSAKGQAATEPRKPKLIAIPSESTIGVTVAVCPECHVGVWTHYAAAGPHTMFVRVGTLDDPTQVAPDVHIYTRSKRSFVQIADGKPQFDEFYPSLEEAWRKESIERHEKQKDKTMAFKGELKKRLADKGPTCA